MVELSGVSGLSGVQNAGSVIEAIGATTANEVIVWRNNTGQRVTISQAGYTPESAVTGVATNNMALQFASRTAAGAAGKNITAVKTYASGTDIAAFVEDALVLSTTTADLQVADGEVVTLEKTENGTGLALPAGVASLQYKFE